jgi:hypothetical protein
MDWHTTIAAAVQPFIFEHAEKFAEELRSFLLSGLEIVAYDQQNNLRASVAERLTLKDDDTRELLRNNTFDFYDDDVDDGGVDATVARSFEANNRQSSCSDEPADSPFLGRRTTEDETFYRGGESMAFKNLYLLMALYKPQTYDSNFVNFWYDVISKVYHPWSEFGLEFITSFI